MENNWQISKSQKELLDRLFLLVRGQVKNVLDVGSGRTSLFYLTDRFKDIIIKALVFPGDERKLIPIKECVKNTNYRIIEGDIRDIDFTETFDVVLAHLFLGEAEKFNGKFSEVLDRLLTLKTRYFIIINRNDDRIDGEYFKYKISSVGEIVTSIFVTTEKNYICNGIVVRCMK